MPKRFLSAFLFFGWMAFVAFASLVSFKGNYTGRLHIPNADKIVHFMFYFIALILGMWFLRDRSRGTLTFFGALVGMLVFTIGFGAIIEVLQHNYTVNREGDFYDALANSLGACCAAIWVNYGVSMKNALTWKR